MRSPLVLFMFYGNIRVSKVGDIFHAPIYFRETFILLRKVSFNKMWRAACWMLNIYHLFMLYLSFIFWYMKEFIEVLQDGVLWLGDCHDI